MPKISVIVPVYRVEKYIERCAVSLFEQTLDDIEFLFIDDCSPDRSINILRNVLDKYPHRKSQVVIHRMEKNSGQAKVREWGILNSTGNYLTHCDSDDWIDLTMYEDLYNKIVSSDADVVVSDYFVEGPTCQSIQKGFYLNSKDYVSDFLVMKNKCCLWNKLYKRSLFFDGMFEFPKGNMGEDMCMIYQILPKCKKIEYVNKAYYHYFINGASICHSFDVSSVYCKFKQIKKNVNLVVDSYSKLGLYSRYEKEMIFLKFHVKQQLEGLLKDKFFYINYLQAYPEISFKILTCKFIPLKMRIKYYLKVMWYNFASKDNVYGIKK